jgi:hypothetical protein
MSEQKFFHGIGVVVAEVVRDTEYDVVAVPKDADTTDFQDLNLRFPIDFTRTPNRTSNWQKVLFDDRGIDAGGIEIPAVPLPNTYQLPITGIGSGTSDSPTRGSFVGGVYIWSVHYKKLKPDFFPWAPAPEVQLTSIVERTGELDPVPTLTRYHGFVATVVSSTPTDVTFTFDKPNDKLPPTTIPKDLILMKPEDDARCGVESLAPAFKQGTTGAVFIHLQTAVGVGLFGPKIPKGFGI